MSHSRDTQEPTKRVLKYCGNQTALYTLAVGFFTGGAITSAATAQPLGALGCGGVAYLAYQKGNAEFEKCVNEEMRKNKM